MSLNVSSLYDSSIVLTYLSIIFNCKNAVIKNKKAPNKTFQGPTFVPPSNLQKISLTAEKVNSEGGQLETVIATADASLLQTMEKSGIEQKKLIDPCEAEFLEYLSKLIDSVEW